MITSIYWYWFYPSRIDNLYKDVTRWQLNTGTVKHAYSKHTHNELILIVKWFSSPVDFKHIVKITDITNYVYNEEKSPVPCTSGTVVFLEYLKTNKSKCNINQDMFQNLTTETI